METPIHNHLDHLVRALLPSVSEIKPHTVLQFVVRDKQLSAFVVVDRAAQPALQVRTGKHGSPDASIVLTSLDLKDIGDLGCVRGPVSMTGHPQLLSSFRDKFMSISAEGKARVEELTRASRHRAPETAPETAPEIERISAASLSATEFLQRYAMPSRPVVIAGAMPKWSKAPWTIDRIRAELGDTAVNVRAGNYAADIYQQTMVTQELLLRDYLDSYAGWTSDDPSASPPPYAASSGVPWEWHLWLDYPPFVPENLCSFAKFWIGPRGTTTPLHRDWLDNFLTQVVGTKRIALIAPGHGPAIKPRVIHAGLDSCNWVDPFDPGDPVAASCQPAFVTLDAGDMLFLPAGWFHDVRSTAFSFSVNFFLMRVPYAVCPPDWTAPAAKLRGAR